MKERDCAKKERNRQAAFVCAEAFQKLAEEFIPRIPLIKTKSSQAMSNELGDLVACATNIGFAIELYLKALLMQQDRRVPQTHDLCTLYNAVPQPVRALIESVYDTFLPDQLHQLHGHASFTLAKGPLEEPLWDDHAEVSLALPDLLARSRDIFQSWRYMFEYSPTEESLYQFHKFEYAPLRCAAEAMRVETKVRLHGTGESQPPNPAIS